MGLAYHSPVAISVLIVDDHEVVRRGLVDLLATEPGMDAVGPAASAEEALELLDGNELPDVALLDVRLPGMSGVELCRELKDRSREVRCIMLTSYADDEALVAAVMAGADGYLLKDVGGDELLGHIRRVKAGGSLLDPALVAPVVQRVKEVAHEAEALRELSPQERRVLELLADGMTNRQISEQLFLAEKTVKNYVSNLLAKLGMSRRTEAAVFLTKLRDRGLAGS